MKTKYSRFGNSAIALVLSAIMLLSSSIVGSSSTVTTKASEANSAAVEETTPSETVTEEALTEETASENGSVFVDNEEVGKTDLAEEPVVKLGSSKKVLPEKSGDGYTFYYCPDSGDTKLYIHAWNSSGDLDNWGNGTYPATKMNYESSTGLYYYTYSGLPTNIMFVRQTSSGRKDVSTTDIVAGNIYNKTDENTGVSYSTYVACKNSSVTNTVYYRNTKKWSNVYCYAWCVDQENATWPGAQMSLVEGEDDVYSIVLDKTYTSVIFNDGSNQTANLTLSYNGTSLANNFYDEDTWITYNSGSSSGIDITDGKTYLLYYVNSYNTWTPRYAHFWNDSSALTEWPGVKLKSVEGYDNLYALDVSLYSTATKVQFSDGSGKGDKIGERDFDYSAHQGEDMDFSYSSTTYNSSSSTKKVYVANQQKYNYTDNYNNVHYVRRFGVRDLSDVLGTSTVIPGDGEVNVYAKSGTVRDHHTDFNKYSKLATTEIWADGAEATDAKHGFSGFETQYPNDGDSSYRVEHAAVKKGTKINITTTLNSSVKNKYYVKAFCINGKSYNIIDESKADTSNGVYTCSYIVPDNAQAVEITPIYYYIEGNNSSNYITFAVEDFAGSVKEKWGNTIACYAWYEHGVENIQNGEATANALGGYPGQPMVSEGGSFYMQIPKYVEGLGQIKGITLNNYIWDDIHGMPLRRFSDFNGLNNTVGGYTDDNRRQANAQTYDYDDFVALSALDDVSEVIFSFKYRTYNNANAVYGDNNDGLGNQPDNTANFGQNGWDVLVDYDDHPVDLFGNDLTNSNLTNFYQKDTDVFNEDNAKKLFVVSDGYINYYTNSTVSADQVNNDYLGEYATKWYVYTFDGTTYTYQGALPPSAFITTPTLADYSSITAKNETAAKAEFAKYLTDGVVHTAAVNKLFNTYETLFNNYKNWPVEITYESALNANGRYGAVDRPGYRNDGRWYYSRKSTTIHANTKIYIIDKDGDLKYEGASYTLDEYGIGKKANVGTTTGAKACFANSDKGLKHAGETSLTDVVKDSEDYFNLTADSSSIVTDGDKTYQYTFEGWYLDTGGSVLNPITESTKAYRRMNSFATFVAVYSKAEVGAVTTKNLVVNHKLYANESLTTADPAAHDGTGKTYVESITIKDSSDEVLGIITGNEVDALNVDLADTNYSGAAKVEVTIRTVPGNDSEMYKIYKYNESGTTTKYADVTGTLPGATATGTTVTYTYTVSDLFGTGEGAKSYAQIDLFSDLKRTSTAKDIALEFKFYDRDVQNNKTATIKSTETTLHYTLTDITDYASLKNKLGSFVGTKSDEGIEFLGDLTNVVDDYYIWSSQTQAMDDYAGIGDHYYYKDDTLNNNGKEKYKDLDNYDTIKAYHTDYLSTPQTSGEKWITYYNGEKEITDYIGSTDTNDGITVYNDNVDVTDLTKVVLWAFNAPKQYTLKVCTDQKTNDENGEPAYRGTLISANQGEGNDALYFFGDEESIDASMYTGFYNQRVGAADTYGAESNGSDAAVDYLKNYFGRTGEGAVTTDIAYTGDVVEAPQTATGESYDTGNRDENDNPIMSTEYYFDGWYTKAHNGSYVKVSSDRIYGNRITSDLTLYSMYKKVNAYASDSSIGGTTATSNGTDVYVTETTNNVPVKNVRLNTQLNVYYDGENIDNDSNIKQVSVIYVNLNDTEAASDESIAAAGVNAKAWINANKSFLTQKGKVRQSGKVTMYSGDTDKHVVIMDTYENTTSANTNLQITLTSKNRVQFVLPMTSALYDDTYNNLIAFVAIQYQDGENTPAEWYVSDNYVSYVHG